MHLELDWELAYYKQEVVQVAPGMKHQTTAYADPLFVGKSLSSTEKDTAT